MRLGGVLEANSLFNASLRPPRHPSLDSDNMEIMEKKMEATIMNWGLGL